jgi:hypothetical protein
MLPWGHAAVGYLLYTALSRSRTGNTPEGAAVLALAVGTQFADLVDKPLAWYLGALPSGRSLAHSLFVAVALLLVLDRLAVRYERRDLSIAFTVGHLTHLAGDTIYGLGDGVETFRFLLWPAVPQTGTETGYTILQMLIELTLSPIGIFESVLFVAATGLWVSHRAPGLWLCLDILGRLKIR